MFKTRTVSKPLVNSRRISFKWKQQYWIRNLSTFFKITLATLLIAKNISKRRYIGESRNLLSSHISISSTFEVAGSADKILTMGLQPFPCTEYQVLILNKQRQAVNRVPPKKEDCWHLEKTTIKTKFPHKLRLLQTLRKGELTNGSFAQGHCLFLPLFFLSYISEFFFSHKSKGNLRSKSPLQSIDRYSPSYPTMLSLYLSPLLFMDLSFESDEIEGSKERVLSCAAAVSVMGKRVILGREVPFTMMLVLVFVCGCVGCWSSVKRSANSHANKPQNLRVIIRFWRRCCFS